MSVLTDKQNVRLDLIYNHSTPPERVVCKQGDMLSRQIKIGIYDRGKFRDDISTNYAEVYIEGIKGNPPTYLTATVTEGVCEFKIPQSATKASGKIRAELRLKDAATPTTILSTMTFYIEVEESVYSVDALLGTNDGDVLTNMVADATDAAERAEEYAEQAKTAAGKVQNAIAAANGADLPLGEFIVGCTGKEVATSGLTLRQGDIKAVEPSALEANLLTGEQIKNAFAIKGALMDCHGFPGPGLYSIPSTATHLPTALSFDPAKHAILMVTDSEVTATTNYRYSLTLIAPGGTIYVKQLDADGRATAWTERYAANLAKKVDKIPGKGLSTNDYTDSDKAAVETIADKLNLPLYDVGNIDANTLTTPGIYATSYAVPQNFPFTDSGAMPLLIVAEAGRMPDISSGSPDFSNAKTLLQICIGKGGEVYSRYKIAGDGDLSAWSWSQWSTKAVSVTNSLTGTSTTAALSAAQGKVLNEKKQDKAWQTLANLTVAEGEEASSIKIALPDAITTCNELMIEVEFYVGSEATSRWLPTFCFADVDKTKYACWLGGGGNGSVAPGTKYYFELYGWVGDSRLLTFYGPANQHMNANSRATAYMARASLGYRSGHSSYTCYLHMDIASNTFTAGTKIKLLGR